MSQTNLTQKPQARNGHHFTEAEQVSCFPQADNQIPWLQAKIEHYQSEITRLEHELAHARALLKGHQIWLIEAEKAGER